MAILAAPHWEAISPEMMDLYYFLEQQSFLSRYYLAGGTALALQIGHRRSVDFDFFSEIDEVGDVSRAEIVRGLRARDAQVEESGVGNLLMLVNGIHVGFFGYGYPLVSPPLMLGNMALAGPADIGLMKLDALITRGSRKDFLDLFFISRLISFETLLQLSEKKYSMFRDFPLMALESMLQFERADGDIQPEMLMGVSWYEVKAFFVSEAERLSHLYFDE
jgi:hypothetical protein